MTHSSRLSGLRQEMFRAPGSPPQGDTYDYVASSDVPGTTVDPSQPEHHFGDMLAFTQSGNVYYSVRENSGQRHIVNMQRLTEQTDPSQAIMQPWQSFLSPITIGKQWRVPVYALSADTPRKYTLGLLDTIIPIGKVMVQRLFTMPLGGRDLSKTPVSPFSVIGDVRNIVNE